MGQKYEFEGQVYDAPDDATPDEVIGFLNKLHPPPVPQVPSHVAQERLQRLVTPPPDQSVNAFDHEPAPYSPPPLTPATARALTAQLSPGPLSQNISPPLAPPPAPPPPPRFPAQQAPPAPGPWAPGHELAAQAAGNLMAPQPPIMPSTPAPTNTLEASILMPAQAVTDAPIGWAQNAISGAASAASKLSGLAKDIPAAPGSPLASLTNVAGAVNRKVAPIARDVREALPETDNARRLEQLPALAKGANKTAESVAAFLPESPLFSNPLALGTTMAASAKEQHEQRVADAKKAADEAGLAAAMRVKANDKAETGVEGPRQTAADAAAVARDAVDKQFSETKSAAQAAAQAAVDTLLMTKFMPAVTGKLVPEALKTATGVKGALKRLEVGTAEGAGLMGAQAAADKAVETVGGKDVKPHEVLEAGLEGAKEGALFSAGVGLLHAPKSAERAEKAKALKPFVDAAKDLAKEFPDQQTHSFLATVEHGINTGTMAPDHAAEAVRTTLEGRRVDTSRMKVPPEVADQIAKEQANEVPVESKLPAPEAEKPSAPEAEGVAGREVAGAEEGPRTGPEKAANDVGRETAVPARGAEVHAPEEGTPAADVAAGPAADGGRGKDLEAPGRVEKEDYGEDEKPLVDTKSHYEKQREQINFSREQERRNEKDDHFVNPYKPVSNQTPQDARETHDDMTRMLKRYEKEIAAAPVNKDGVGWIPLHPQTMNAGNGVTISRDNALGKLLFERAPDGKVVRAAMALDGKMVGGIARFHAKGEFGDVWDHNRPVNKLLSKATELGVERTPADAWTPDGARMAQRRIPERGWEKTFLEGMRGAEDQFAADGEIKYLPGMDRSGESLDRYEIERGLDDISRGVYHSPEAETLTQFVKSEHRNKEAREAADGEKRGKATLEAKPGPGAEDRGARGTDDVGAERPVGPGKPEVHVGEPRAEAARGPEPEPPAREVPPAGDREPVRSKEQLRQRLEALGARPDQALADSEIFDARAKTWARMSGRPVDEYYDKFNVVRGNEAGDLQQPPTREEFEKQLLPGEIKGKGKTRENVIDRARKLLDDDAIPEYLAAMKAGVAAKGWYKHSGDVMKSIFGEDFPRFTKLLAALSPQQPVDANLRMALDVWNRWEKAGRPQDTKTLMDMFGPVRKRRPEGKWKVVDLQARGPNALRALQDEVGVPLSETDPGLSGDKVNSFAGNIMGDPNLVTNDAHMASMREWPDSVFGTKSGYLAGSYYVRKAAAEMGWEPREGQETGWSFWRTLRDLTEKHGDAREVMRTMTHRDILNGGSDFALLLTEDPNVRKLLEDPNVRKRLAEAGVDLENLSPDRGHEGLDLDAPVLRGAEGVSPEALEKLADRAQRLRDKQYGPRDKTAPAISAEDLRPEALEDKNARRTAAAYRAGKASLHDYVDSQRPGTKIYENGETYLSSMSGPMRLASVPIEDIQDRQQRFRNPEIVKQYQAQFEGDREVEPITLDSSRTKPGTLFVRDGHHRLEAAEKAGATHIEAWLPLGTHPPTELRSWAEAHTENGGQTRDPYTGAQPEDGYVVSPYKDHELTLDHPPTEAEIQKYLEQKRAVLASDPRNRFGSWRTDDGRHVLDVSRHVTDAAEAQRLGRANDQEAYFDVAKGESVPVQKSVTLNQSTYLTPFTHPKAPDTPEFKQWFGDSKVVGDDGAPKPVYHGGIEKFDTFKPTAGVRGGFLGASRDVTSPAFFFSESPYVARAFGDNRAEWKDMQAKVHLYKTFLSIENPFDMTRSRSVVVRDLKRLGLDLPDSYWPDKHTMWSLLDDPAVVERLKVAGYDGAKLSEAHAAKDFQLDKVDPNAKVSWAAFSPEQIKSADKNSGAFDPNDPNIYKQDAREGPLFPNRGSITFGPDGSSLIRLAETADGTTFAHEAWHHAVKMFGEIADDALPEFRPRLQQDLRTLNRYVGAADDARPKDWTVGQHEKLAEGGERYLKDGKAPTPALKKAFETLRQIFKDVYSVIKGTPIENRLPRDVKEVFDRWHGKEDVAQRQAGGVTEEQSGTVGSLSRNDHPDQPANVPLGQRIRALVGLPATTAGGGTVVPDARRTFSTLGNLKDIFGGYGLNQLSEASPATESVVREQAASAAKSAALMRLTMPKILDALEVPKDATPEERKRAGEQFMSALAQSRLEGIQDKLDDILDKLDTDPSQADVDALKTVRDKMADPKFKSTDFTKAEQALVDATHGIDLAALDDAGIRQTLRDAGLRELLESGTFDTMISALDGRKGFETFDKDGKVDGYRDLQGEWDDVMKAIAGSSHMADGVRSNRSADDHAALEHAREFLADTLETWRRNIGRVELRTGQPETGESFLYPKPESDAGAERFFDDYVDSPQFQEALAVYKAHLEPAFKRAHELNEGKFTEHLGPLDTYYPLSQINEQTESRRSDKTVAYRRPKNPNNFFATGLGDYDVSADAMRKNLARAMSQNGKAGILGTLKSEGLLTTTRPGIALPDTVVWKGVEYRAKHVPIGATKMIDKNGRVQNVAAPMAAVPEWVAKELEPILDPKHAAEDERRLLQAITGAVTTFNMGGPTDAVYHTANMLATLITKSPIVGTSLIAKTASAIPLAKSIAAIANILAYDVNTPERQARLERMIKNGQVPSRYGTQTYDKEYAAANGAEYEGPRNPVYQTEKGKDLPLIGKTRLRMPIAFGPMIFGPEGIDIRARMLMDEIGDHIAEKSGIELTPEERFQWTSQLGNYVYALEGRIERAAKASGFAPFFTAGRQMNENALSALMPIGKLPSSRLQKGDAGLYRAMQITSGLVGMTAAWAIASKLYRGKFPWDDDKAKLFQIPLNDDDRDSTVGRAIWGDDVSRTGYVNLGFLNPLLGRGLRLTGLGQVGSGLMQGRSFGDIVDRATVDMANTIMHPVLGPPVHTLMNALTGQEAYIERMTRNGRPDIKLKAAIQGDAGTGLERIGKNLAHALIGANPIARRIFQAHEEGQPASRVLLDTALPNLIKGPSRADYSPLETYLSDYAQEHPFPGEPSTPERRQGRDLATSLTSQLRVAYDANDTKRIDALTKQADDAEKAGKLLPSEHDRIFKNADMTKHAAQFSRLPIDAAIEAYSRGSDADKIELADALEKKRQADKWREGLTDAEVAATEKRIDDLLDEADAAAAKKKR